MQTEPIPFSLRYECRKCGEVRMNLSYNPEVDILRVECDRCEAVIWMYPKDKDGSQ